MPPQNFIIFLFLFFLCRIFYVELVLGSNLLFTRIFLIINKCNAAYVRSFIGQTSLCSLKAAYANCIYISLIIAAYY